MTFLPGTCMSMLSHSLFCVRLVGVKCFACLAQSLRDGESYFVLSVVPLNTDSSARAFVITS